METRVSPKNQPLSQKTFLLVLRSNKDDFHNHRDRMPYSRHQFFCCTPLHGSTNFTSLKSASKKPKV